MVAPFPFAVLETSLFSKVRKCDFSPKLKSSMWQQNKWFLQKRLFHSWYGFFEMVMCFSKKKMPCTASQINIKIEFYHPTSIHEKNQKRKRKVFSTGDSNVVTHHSTNPAHMCLTSEFGWDRVFSHGYDRRRPI